jgi:peroxiredoxin
MPDLGTPAPDFDLTDTRGERVQRSDFQGMPLLVMFICNHCPYVKHLNEHLAQLTRRYLERGVAVVGISANDPVSYPQDSPERMAREAEEVGYDFPYLFDATQEVAKAYRAACTPDFFLYDGDHRLIYRGQYDASRPGNGLPVTGRDLAAALDAVLEGTEPPGEQIPSVGCNIKWRAGNTPDYYG